MRGTAFAASSGQDWYHPMTTPVDITFRNMAPSPILDEEIRARAAWLESYHPRIQGCRVVLEVPHRHQRRGREILVAVEIGLPEGAVHVHHKHPPSADNAETSSMAISDDHPEHRHHQEAREAIREAFHVARRRVSDAVRRHRGL